MEKIIFSPPDISEEEIAEVVDTLKSGWITTGPKTKRLEEEIARFCHTKRAVCLNSATACMELALRMFGVGEGDEVITTAYTYTATCSVICHVGAVPVILDTGKDSYEIDYEAISGAITERTKVIMPVDIAGVMCDYDRIFDIVNSKRSMFRPASDFQEKFGRIIVLADAAHSFGAVRDGKMSGEAADFSSFSFHAVKNFTTGEGGALVWKPNDNIDDEELYRQFQLLSLHGQSKDALAKTKAGAWEYDIMEPYYKCNMTDIMASIGLIQMKRYDALLARRRDIMKMYYDGLDSSKVSVITHYTKNSTSCGHLCLVRVKGADRERCNRIITAMAQKGVPLNVHFKPLPLLSAYKKRGYDIADYPNAYAMYSNTITLPLHTKLTDEQAAYIIDSFNETLENVL
ncbi:MAG: DegT/DnrJ/EryC1/StrS aminotransferase family protein [Lachnospiraceae bacterium]|nr:DegT/DnrJ/EryC1/StrS aminotransferase family protein [Lachnospiraceae bacterium]